MFEHQICRICLTNKVRLHQILGSEVQDVYEKLTNKVQEDGNLYFACYICYRQLKNCHQLVTKLQKSKELLQQRPIRSQFHLRCISYLDRLTHGLINSLTATNIESLQIPKYNEFIKIEKQDESDSNEKIFGDGSDVEFGKDAPSLKQLKLSENHNIKDGDVNSIESDKKENIFKIETNTAPDSNNLSRIVNDEKSKQVLVKKTFICNICGKTCKKKAVLIEHINGHTSVTIKPNETNIKKKKYSCEKKYKSEIYDDSNKNLPYQCKHCNYISASGSALKIHIRTHTGEKPFNCEYCSYTCTGSSNLKRHIRYHAEEKPFKCQYCSYTCTVSSYLKRHIRIHTGEKPFKCRHCSYACTQSGDLTRHVRTHTGERPFKCQYCSYTCTTSSYLKLHIRSHTGEKPFKCRHCSYAFIQSGDLTRHIRTHTGEKAFKCRHCSYTCIRNGDLTRHIRTHTGARAFKCEICDKKFRVRSTLKKHLRVHMDNKIR